LIKKFSYIICFLLAGIPSTLFAAPDFSGASASGVLNAGETITITNASGLGSGPDSLSADYWDVFDDYDSDGECGGPGINDCGDGNDDAFPDDGNVWADDGDGNAALGWIIFQGDEDNMISVNPRPLMEFKTEHAQYSTGRGYARHPEYYEGGSGGLPNAGLFWGEIDSTTEIYVVAYINLVDWDDPQTTVYRHKFIEFFMSNGNKCHIQLEDQEHQTGDQFDPAQGRFFPTFGEIGGDSSTCDVPDADGEWPGENKWFEIKLHIKLNTLGETDGVFELWINGQQAINDSTVDMRGSNNITFENRAPYFFGNIQCPSSGVLTCPGSGEEWEERADDIFLWVSDQSSLDSVFPVVPCVYLSNESSWGDGPSDILNGDATFVRQKVGGTSDLGFRSWSDTGFQFEVNTSGLNTSAPIYLYSYDWSGAHNSDGMNLGSISPTATGITFSGGVSFP